MTYSGDRVPMVLAVTISTTALAFVCTTLRLATRFRLKSLGIDDCFITIGLIFVLATMVAVTLQTRFGLGRHESTVPDSDIESLLKSFYASVVAYGLAISLIKMSLLFQYRRIFPSPFLQKASLISLIFIACVGTVQLFMAVFLCYPIAAVWDPTIKAKCIDRLVGWITNAAINILTDIAVFTLPLPFLSSLQLPGKQKFFLIGVFSLGFLACLVSIVRIYFMEAATDDPDFTWANSDSASWSVVELNWAVIVACLPTLRPLLSKFFQTFRTTSTPNRSKNSDSSRHSKSRDLENGGRRSFRKGSGIGATERTSSMEDLYYSDQYQLKSMKSADTNETNKDGVMITIGAEAEGTDLTLIEQAQGDSSDKAV